MITPSQLASLWHQHASGLVLLVRARYRADAEDLVQEAFIRLSAQRAVPQDPLAWLAKTARNLAIDHARSESRRRKRESQFTATQESWFDDESVVEEAQREAVAALQKIPEAEREILVAHIWNAMSFRQIAEAFNMRSSTVHRRYQAGLKSLKSILDADVRLRA